MESNESSEQFLFRTEIVSSSNEALLGEILRVEEECFPKEWRYEDERGYYAEMLNDTNAINIFLKNEREYAGYLLAVPLDDTYDELVSYDPELIKDSNCYYLETMGVRPNFSGKGGSSMLLDALSRSVAKRGFPRISTHARVINGLSRSIKLKYAGLFLEERSLSRWHFGGNEPYDYLKWSTIS